MPNVLIIDDSATTRLFYRETLEAAGFAVDEAINGLEGLEKTMTSPFDLIIVDINMPKMDGLTFLSELRKREEVRGAAGDHDLHAGSSRRPRQGPRGRRQRLFRQTDRSGNARSLRPPDDGRAGSAGPCVMNPLLAQFIPEARDLLDRASNGMLALEREPDDARRHQRRVPRRAYAERHVGAVRRRAADAPCPCRRGSARRGARRRARPQFRDRRQPADSLDLVGAGSTRWKRRERLPDDAEANRPSARSRCAPGWRRSRRPRAPRRREPSNGAPPAWLAEFSEADRLAAFRAAAGRHAHRLDLRSGRGLLLPRRRSPRHGAPFAGAARACASQPNRAIGALDSLDPLQCWLRFQAISDARAARSRSTCATSPIASRSSRSTPPTSSLPIGAHAPKGRCSAISPSLRGGSWRPAISPQLSRSIATLSTWRRRRACRLRRCAGASPSRGLRSQPSARDRASHRGDRNRRGAGTETAAPHAAAAAE